MSLSDTMLHKWAMPHGFCNRHMNTVEYVLCFMACCTSDCNSENFNPLQPLQRDFSTPIIWVYVMAQQACLRMVSCDSVFVVVTLSLFLSIQGGTHYGFPSLAHAPAGLGKVNRKRERLQPDCSSALLPVEFEGLAPGVGIHSVFTLGSWLA